MHIFEATLVVSNGRRWAGEQRRRPEPLAKRARREEADS
jgi:hypothetical protein